MVTKDKAVAVNYSRHSSSLSKHGLRHLRSTVRGFPPIKLNLFQCLHNAMNYLELLSMGLGIFLGFMILGNVFRIVWSWYPQIDLKQFPYSLIYYPTEPLLFLLRKLIPPLGGVDMAPVVAVAFFSLVRELLLGQQGILTLMLLD